MHVDFRPLKLVVLLFLLTVFCIPTQAQVSVYDVNIFDYSARPKDHFDRDFHSFSDEGAWFSFALPEDSTQFGGFLGPFLMSYDNGRLLGTNTCQLFIEDITSHRTVDWRGFTRKKTAFRSHIVQLFENPEYKVVQTLFFTSSRSAFLYTQVMNKTDRPKRVKFKWKIDGNIRDMKRLPQSWGLLFKSDRSMERTLIYSLDKFDYVNPRDPYPVKHREVEIPPGEIHVLHNGISVLLPGDDFKKEEAMQRKVMLAVQDSLDSKKEKKASLSRKLQGSMDQNFRDSAHVFLLNKALLTLQLNHRVGAGLIEHDGLFPSYRYKGFYGFWSWDSWKHAVALVKIDTALAKDQIRAMYDFQTDEGFIPDCVYADTTKEKHNYRNTKPPLSGWAIWEIYKETGDTSFLREMYPKLKLQHDWWYVYRDHDKDGICEYGSQDGTLEAAKWESGMDNAVRFDESEILSQGDTIFSLNQESVDLNSYLLQEKLVLAYAALVLKDSADARAMKNEVISLQSKIQKQFFDASTGWFYDTSIDGKTFVKSMGCEGWTPLFTNSASKEQAEAVKSNMMIPEKFFGTVPFQTLAADHTKFQPKDGYWRGPVWLDQAYFGVIGLKNYGFTKEANAAKQRLLRNPEGLLNKNQTIRETYHPLTGKAQNAENFSWSAAHVLLLLLDK